MKKKKINLDISKINSKAEINKFDFGWYDLNTIKLFREDLLKNIIPIIKINKSNKKNNPSLILSVNIFLLGCLNFLHHFRLKNFLKANLMKFKLQKNLFF